MKPFGISDCLPRALRPLIWLLFMSITGMMVILTKISKFQIEVNYFIASQRQSVKQVANSSDYVSGRI